VQVLSLIISDFAHNFTEGVLMHWNILCKRLQHYSQFSIFDGILKTSMVTPFIAIVP